MFWATVRCGARFSSWWIMLMPIRCAAPVLVMLTGEPLMRMVPESRRYTPARIFIRVRLARPVLPDEGVNLARVEVETAVHERMDAGKVLADAEHLDQELRHR
jgi:hypothetical protein